MSPLVTLGGEVQLPGPAFITEFSDSYRILAG